MKIVFENPPIIDFIKNSGLNPNERTIFAYGDTIYAPSGETPPQDLIVHEETHSRQQGDNPEAWWYRYATEPYFRLDQEVEAYAMQYKFICKKVTDKNQRFRILMQLANVLSSPVYGSMVSTMGAHNMIKNKANIR